jgi:hypothetical protein
MMAPGMMGGGFGGGGFLRSAATTAAGIAGGALLFEGIQSMFGGHGGGGLFGGSQMQPGLSETVINNYYENDPNAANATQDAAWDQPAGSDPGVDYAADTSNAQNAGFESDSDFGGGDDYT